MSTPESQPWGPSLRSTPGVYQKGTGLCCYIQPCLASITKLSSFFFFFSPSILLTCIKLGLLLNLHQCHWGTDSRMTKKIKLEKLCFACKLDFTHYKDSWSQILDYAPIRDKGGIVPFAMLGFSMRWQALPQHLQGQSYLICIYT